MSLGLKKAGIDIKLAFDNNEQAVKTYNHNVGNNCYLLDATKVSGKELLERAKINEELDIFSGGPPCQGFSKQRRGAYLLDDPRNLLVLNYARLVKETRAKSFIFENVEVFGQKRGHKLVEEIEKYLHDYIFTKFFLSGENFALAQKRGRFIIIGIRKDYYFREPTIPLSTKKKTVKDVIGHFPSPPEDYTEHPEFPNHIKSKISKLNEERISHVPSGGGWQDIPDNIRLKCHQGVDVKTGGWPDVYGRLKWDDFCPTITAGFDSFTRGRYAHPEQNRSITLREGAALQGFPDDFKFIGNRQDIRLQIGNAVPPPMAFALGKAVISSIIKNSPLEDPGSIRYAQGLQTNNQYTLQI